MEASALSQDEAVLLEQGRLDFDSGRYWHAHEAWEDLWNSLKQRNAIQAEILLVKGFIQTAALLYKKKKKKTRGVTNQWAKLVPKLSPWDHAWGFDVKQHVANISVFVDDVDVWEQTYENIRLPVFDGVHD